MKKNPLIKMIVFGVIAIILWGVGFFTKLWDTLPKGAGIHLNPANILRILFWIFATLFVERLLVFLLAKIKPEDRRAKTVTSVISNMLKYIAAIVIFCGVLTILGVNIATIVASIGVIALIIGFGAESLIADVVTGLFILVDNQYNVGDIIEVGGFRGTVSDIGIRTTCVTDPGGNVKIINNSDMKNILNRSDKNSKAVAVFPVPYDTDIPALEEKIPAMLDKIYSYHSDVFKSAPKYLGVDALSASSVDLKFVVEVDESNIYSGTRLLNRELFVGMRDLGVECPFQQVDIHTK
ncbi:MAG: mechanosensitive ion channel family protein [Firmicutes bacterium]|nr:mechanosensitive ion channel family protein [Bacillota bacterium]MBR6236802.1 mechanosensitive ion channel family protein [Bacillota bacterium]